MYGQRGRELLLELKRSDWLPPYNDEAVRACLQEVSLHFDELQDQITATTHTAGSKPPMEARPSLLLHDSAIRRNKRCLLAYHVARLEKLQNKVNHGYRSSNELSSLLSEAEVDFMDSYEKLRCTYAEEMALDLSSLLLPPELDFVQIRILSQNLGTLVTETGTSVSLHPGTIHYLPRNDVEPLIRQGLAEQVDGEEEG